MELVVNPNRITSLTDLSKLIIKAWKDKCKAVYYVRSVTGSVESCTSCAN